MSLILSARVNTRALKCNGYPGRGIIVGLDSDGSPIQVYWIMGRSPNSRNRVFSSEGGRVFTEPADPGEIKDPSLIIYSAMDEIREVIHPHNLFFVVSNGAQTDAVTAEVMRGGTMYATLQEWEYEPDAPNHTSRITAVYSPGSRPKLEMAILRKSFWDEIPGCQRSFYSYDELSPGVGFCVTTYEGDAAAGKPLLSFQGEPYPVLLEGDLDDIAGLYWDEEAAYFSNLISLAVKKIGPGRVSKLKIVNKMIKTGPLV